MDVADLVVVKVASLIGCRWFNCYFDLRSMRISETRSWPVRFRGRDVQLRNTFMSPTPRTFQAQETSGNLGNIRLATHRAM